MPRTIKERIISGLSNLALFLLGLMLMGDGWRRLFGSPRNHQMGWPNAMGWAELVVAAVTLFFTAHVWLLLLGGIAVAVIFKGLFMLLTGTNIYPILPVANPRREGMAFFLYGLATLLLLFRFAKKKPANLDRIALTAYVFCWLPAGGPEFSLWLAAGLLMLVLSWAVYRWRTGPASI